MSRVDKVYHSGSAQIMLLTLKATFGMQLLILP